MIMEKEQSKSRSEYADKLAFYRRESFKEMDDLIMLHNVIRLLAQRRQYAQSLKYTASSTDDRKVVEAIEYINDTIKKLLAL